MTTDTSGSYAYDFSAFPQDVAAGGSPAGMSFMSAGSQPAGAGGATGDAPAASGGAASGGAPAGGGMGGGAPGGGDLGALIAQSPFGSLLNLPGVTAENLFSNVNPADYGGGNPFGALAGVSGGGAAAPYGGNPFASIGTLVTNDYNAATQGGTASSMGMGAGGNPFGGV